MNERDWRAMPTRWLMANQLREEVLAVEFDPVQPKDQPKMTREDLVAWFKDQLYECYQEKIRRKYGKRLIKTERYELDNTPKINQYNQHATGEISGDVTVL